MANAGFFDSYEEEFFGLDIEGFDLSMSRPVPEHGVDGQSLFTDGSGRTAWGGLNYVLLLGDQFNNITGGVDRNKWINIGPGFEDYLLHPGALTIGGFYGGLTEVAMIEPFTIEEISQLKLEANVYLLGNIQSDYCFYFGLHSTADDDTWIWLVQDSDCASEQYKFACWNQGDITYQFVTIADEVWTEIAIVINKGKATFYKNNVATAVIKSNIATKASWDFRFAATTDFDHAAFDYINIKQIITGDAF